MRCPTCDHDNIQGEDLCKNCGMDLAGLDVEAWGVSPEDPLLVVPIGDLPLKQPLVLPPEATVTEAIELMQRRHEGCVFVEDSEARLVGIVGEREITVRVAAPGRDPAETRLADIMTRHPIVLDKKDALAWALHRMGVDGHRHLAVVDEDRPAGLLSIRTVLRVLLDA